MSSGNHARGTRRFKMGFPRVLFEALERRRLFAVVGVSMDGISTDQIFQPLDGLHFSGTLYEVMSPQDLSAYTPRIDWGDGTTSVGEFVRMGIDRFAIVGDHTFASKGFFGVDLYVAETNQQIGQNVPGLITQAEALERVDQQADLPFGPIKIAWKDRDEDINIASFFDRAATSVDQYTVAVDWGDGTSGAADRVYTGAGNVLVSGAHQWAEPGLYTVSYTITRPDGASLTGQRTFELIGPDDAGVKGSVELFSATAGISVGGIFATFTGVQLGESDPADARARVNFGDGTEIEGIVGRRADGIWYVSANHVYEKPGVYDVTVLLRRDVGPRPGNSYSGVPYISHGATNYDLYSTAKMTVNAGAFAGEGFSIGKAVADDDTAADLTGEIVARFTPSDSFMDPANVLTDIMLVDGDRIVNEDDLPNPVINVEPDGTWTLRLPGGSLGRGSYSYQVELFNTQPDQSVIGTAYGQLYSLRQAVGDPSSPTVEPTDDDSVIYDQPVNTTVIPADRLLNDRTIVAIDYDGQLTDVVAGEWIIGLDNPVEDYTGYYTGWEKDAIGGSFFNFSTLSMERFLEALPFAAEFDGFIAYDAGTFVIRTDKAVTREQLVEQFAAFGDVLYVIPNGVGTYTAAVPSTLPAAVVPLPSAITPPGFSMTRIETSATSIFFDNGDENDVEIL